MRNYFLRKDVVTEKEAERRIFETHKNSISLIEFFGSSKKAQFKCNVCDFAWIAKANSVWGGNGCPECRNKKAAERYKFTFEYVYNYIRSKNCNLVSKDYINTKENLDIEFECGHVSKISFECFKRGQRCKCESIKKRQVSTAIKTEKNILKVLEDNNFKFIKLNSERFNWDADIVFECEFGHLNIKNVREFMRRKNCTECTKTKQKESQTGSKGSNWQGGLTKLKVNLQKHIIEWKKKSMENCDYLSILSHQRFDDIHHLYPFNSIVKDALEELGLKLMDKIGDFDEETYSKLREKVLEIHFRYPLGVCLTKSEHKLFHKLYGLRNNTPDQFYEFQSRYLSGEFQTI